MLIEYEIEFGRIAKERHVISFTEIKSFFAALGLFPSKIEVSNALEHVLGNKGLFMI